MIEYRWMGKRPVSYTITYYHMVSHLLLIWRGSYPF